MKFKTAKARFCMQQMEETLLCPIENLEGAFGQCLLGRCELLSKKRQQYGIFHKTVVSAETLLASC